MVRRNSSFFSTDVELKEAPINRDFILEGEPQARNHVLSRGSDGLSQTIVWECTTGKFNWVYNIDETCYFIEGSAIIDDGVNGPRTLSAGDVAFFPAGSTAHWHVENYVKKVAFCQRVLPAVAARAIGVLRAMKKRGSRGANASML